MDNISETIRKVLTDQVVSFTVKDTLYNIYPQTLGKMYLTAPLIESLGIDKQALSTNPFEEILRVVMQHKEECALLIAYHTIKEKEALISTDIPTRLKKKILQDCDNDDLATLLMVILNNEDVPTIAKATEIYKETENISRANKAKDSKNTLIFGGKTVWGSLIDVACERYKWTFDYVLWGISYANLTLLLKDKITSVYLSDKERKRAHIRDYSGGKVNADDKETVMRLVRESRARPI